MNLFNAKLYLQALRKELEEAKMLEDWHLEQAQHHEMKYNRARKDSSTLRNKVQLAEHKFLDKALALD